MNHYSLSVIAGFSAALTIGLLSFFDANIHDVAMVMAPFGATAVLVFGVPNSPLAQPKNVILGHLITAFIGVVFSQYMDVTPITLGIATGLGVTAMLVTKTTHPPAGANPILIMLSGQGWLFLLTPVLVGSVFIVLMAKGLESLKSFQSKATH
ncbi:putative INOSINE-5-MONOPHOSPHATE DEHYDROGENASE RELATED protein [Vibrio nigripulchritudo SOn1]|uniref:INOSINE-5-MONOPHOSPHATE DEHYDROGENASE RELATED protein n=1 Tax=Vibrio nigripulchritudo SOn1 TaxID=1238450 RepID=A0AAV2VRM6_9VIBR|nr:HPP family protein [Vibrio nigripulchritudo]CCO47212.1 putative INOSINE-5-MONOPHOSPHATE DEHYDROGENASE RELATED protein [Vibrio nigripulchritudo SOn1]